MSGIDALILAGGRIDGIPAVPGGKGFIPVNGTPMVGFVARALFSSEQIRRVFIIASEDVRSQVAALDARLILIHCSEEDSVLNKIEFGLKYIGGAGKVLLVAADSPLLTAEAITGFVEKSLASGSDLCYPLIDKKDIDREFPGTQRTFIHLSEGSFTGGNLIFVDAKPILANLPLVKEAYEARKHPMRLIRLLGARLLVKLLMRSLQLEQINRRCSEIIGANCRLCVSPSAELGIDVDKTVDLEFISTILKVR